MKKLKLAIVSPFPPGNGTLNEYAYHLVNRFSEKSELSEIVLITEKLDGDKTYSPIESKVPVTIKPVWSFNSLTNVIKIIRALIQETPDIVFFNIQFLSFGDKKIAAALGLMIPMLCRIIGIPSVVLLHNLVECVDLGSASITKNPILEKIYKFSGTLLTRMLLMSNLMTVTISKYVEILEKKYKSENVALIPHGSFETPPIPDFDEDQDVTRVMTFGKFGTYKKVERLIEAVDMLRTRSKKDIQLVIAGTDSPNRAGYLDSIKKQYHDKNFVQYTGYVEEEDVPRIFRESSVVAFPYSGTTGSSGVLHQAGSYGKACVLPAIGDLKELIEEQGYSGIYFEPENAESMADAIGQILGNDELKMSLARQNYSAAASLPMEDICDWYLLHFNNLCEKTTAKKIVTPISDNAIPQGMRLEKVLG